MLAKNANVPSTPYAWLFAVPPSILERPVAMTPIRAYAISGGAAALGGILLTGYSRQAYLGM